MTKRCRFCGTKMADTVISDTAVYQCPFCGSVEIKPEKPTADEVPEETSAV